VALIVFTVDLVRSTRASRAPSGELAPAPS
jgi:hypothetical protein